MSDDIWREDLRAAGWPECGDTLVDVESLYQAFKERLMRELVASSRADYVVQCGNDCSREVGFHELMERPKEL